MSRLLSTAARLTCALAAGAVTARAVTVAAAAAAGAALVGATTTAVWSAARDRDRRELAPRPLADAVRASLPAATLARPAAFVVLRPGDCAGNLEFLSIFERDGVRDRLPLSAAIAIADHPSDDLAPMRATLAARGLPLPVVRADPPLARVLRVLGRRATPYLFVLDAHGSLAYAASAPATFGEMQRVAGTVSRLAEEQQPTSAPE